MARERIMQSQRQLETEGQEEEVRDRVLSFHLLRDFKTTVSTQTVLDALPEGNDPINHVRFADLELDQLKKLCQPKHTAANEAEKSKDDVTDLSPIWFYLEGKQRGKSRLDSSFKLYVDIKDDRKKTLIFYLNVYDGLLDKIVSSSVSSSFSVRLIISLPGTGGPDWLVDQPNYVYLAEPTSFENSIEGLYTHCSPTTRLKFAYIKGVTPKTGLTMEQLNVIMSRNPQSGRNLKFTWCISICHINRAISGREAVSPNGHSKILENMWNLDAETRDVTIITNGEAEIKCHKLVLMAHGGAFLNMFSPHYETLESKTGVIRLPGNSKEAVELFLRFLYGIKIKFQSEDENTDFIASELAVELFFLAHKYEIKELEDSVKNFITDQGTRWFTPCSLIELYYCTRNIESLEELTAHSLTLLSLVSEEKIRVCEYFKKLGKEEAMSLVFRIMQWR